MKYRVGDWIRVIKRFDPDADYYNTDPFVTKEMHCMQGRCYRISDLTFSGFYSVYENKNGRRWSLTDDMIECRVLTFDGGKTFIPYNENMILEEAE